MKLTTLCYLERDGAYLMLHRNVKKQDANEGKWIGVGGHFEEGEGPEDCLLREVREETGFLLTRYAFRGIVTFVSDRWETEYMCLYTATEWEGEPVPCTEGTLRWVAMDRIEELNLWEGDRVFLRLLRERRSFFSLKLSYEGEKLCSCLLDGRVYLQKASEAQADGMRLVTGGRFQGKYDFVRQCMEQEPGIPSGQAAALIADGADCTEGELYTCRAVNHFELYIRRCMERGEDPEALTEEFLRRNPNAWVITDEVGCGVVPVDAFEREWREAAGRAACRIAACSKEVYRMVCGIPQCLKRETDVC